MAGNVLTYNLTWRTADGKENSREIKIGFVSNFINREFAKMRATVIEFSGYTNRLSAIISEIAAVTVEKPDGYKDKIEELKKEQKAVTDKILTYKDSAFLDERFKLVKEVLVMNGYHADDEICTSEFWDRYTDATTIYDFLSRCVNKDAAEGKKKEARK